jgi:glycosyltransferase involved in cell wall biosynthesis
LKILYLTPPSPDGARLSAFSFVDEEILALARQGVEIFMIAIVPPAEGRRNAHVNISARTLPTGKAWREISRTLRFLWHVKRFIPGSLWLRPLLLYRTVHLERFAHDLILQERIGIIHSQFGWPGGFGGALAAAATSTRLVATLRGMDVLIDAGIDYGLRRSSFYDAAFRTLLRSADRTIHVSDFIRHRAMDLGAPGARAKTIRKGVDYDRFSAAAAGEPRSPTPSILTVAGLIKRKGIDDILKALALLADSHEFSFVVVGEGPEQRRLEELSERLAIRGRTRFDGQVSRADIPKWFAASDIFVLASIWEASGNVLLEAMASGRPVICTDSGGPPEYIEDGVTGFVVPVGSPEAIAAKLGLLLKDPELRSVLGQNGRKHARERFSYGRMIGEIREVYEEVAAT